MEEEEAGLVMAEKEAAWEEAVSAEETKGRGDILGKEAGREAKDLGTSAEMEAAKAAEVAAARAGGVETWAGDKMAEMAETKEVVACEAEREEMKVEMVGKINTADMLEMHFEKTAREEESQRKKEMEKVDKYCRDRTIFESSSCIVYDEGPRHKELKTTGRVWNP